MDNTTFASPDMTQHQVPCLECPFRRTSAPGYLGANDPMEFSSMAGNSNERMPCHSLVDYESDDWKTQQQTSPQCAGRAIYLMHLMRMPRDRSILRLPANKALVFSTQAEFDEHHEVLDDFDPFDIVADDDD